MPRNPTPAAAAAAACVAFAQAEPVSAREAA